MSFQSEVGVCSVGQFVDLRFEFVVGFSGLSFYLRGSFRRRICGFTYDFVAAHCQ